MRIWSLVVLGFLFVAAASATAQDEKILKQLTVEQSEELLKKLGIEFKKLESKTPGTIFYDFKRKNFNIRFYHFDGKDVMLDAVFPKQPLEKLNEWNAKAKFSRACLQRDDKGSFTSLESNLDLLGGVSEGGLRHFFQTFDDELRLFSKFVGDSSSDDLLYVPVTAAKIEAVLKGLSIDFKKNELKEAVGEFFDFEINNHKLQLVNYGGKDLMIDAHFKKISSDDVNRYNVEKKFVRVVSYNIKGREYTALEANLDCAAGTSDGILRNFLLGFLDDTKSFDKYVQGK